MLKLINAIFVAIMNRCPTSYSYSHKELDLQWHWGNSPRYWQLDSTFPFIHIDYNVD